MDDGRMELSFDYLMGGLEFPWSLTLFAGVLAGHNLTLQKDAFFGLELDHT